MFAAFSGFLAGQHRRAPGVRARARGRDPPRRDDRALRCSCRALMALLGRWNWWLPDGAARSSASSPRRWTTRHARAALRRLDAAAPGRLDAAARPRAPASGEWRPARRGAAPCRFRRRDASRPCSRRSRRRSARRRRSRDRLAERADGMLERGPARRRRGDPSSRPAVGVDERAGADAGPQRAASRRACARARGSRVVAELRARADRRPARRRRPAHGASSQVWSARTRRPFAQVTGSRLSATRVDLDAVVGPLARDHAASTSQGPAQSSSSAPSKRTTATPHLRVRATSCGAAERGRSVLLAGAHRRVPDLRSSRPPCCGRASQVTVPSRRGAEEVRSSARSS